MRGRLTSQIVEPEINAFHRMTVQDYNNRQLKSRLCSWAVMGCEKCDMYQYCEYGKEWVRRQAGKATAKAQKPVGKKTAQSVRTETKGAGAT